MLEKWVDGKLVAQPSAPPLHKMRAVRAGPDLRPAKRRLKKHLVAQLWEARRPAIARSRPTVHRDPSSSPRPRAAPVQLAAAGGRGGDGARDDGGGSGDGDSGGGSEPPARSRGVRVLERGGQS